MSNAQPAVGVQAAEVGLEAEPPQPAEEGLGAGLMFCRWGNSAAAPTTTCPNNVCHA